jgi:cytochrome c peroxidase
MKRLALVAGAVVLVAAVALAVVLTRGSDEATGDPHAGVGELAPGEMGRILAAVESASTAQDRAALVAEGRRLFRSTELAKSGESCQTCHLEGGGTNADVGTIVHPQEQGDFSGPRDVPSLWGVADTPPYGWAGKEDSLNAFAVGTIRSHFKTGESQSTTKTAEQAAAITAYLRTLAPPVTAFDTGRLSAAARRGEELFQGKGGCIGCHSGALLTDNALHNTLVPKVNPGDTDPGGAGGGPLANAFNPPQMRDLRNTAPYMHNGVLPTLRSVVEFYDHDSSLGQLQLTESEIDDLVAYLESL